MPNFRRAGLRARALREKHGTTELPIDVRQLARLEGVVVDPADLGDEVSGVLIKSEGRAVIGVNGRDAPTRQRFTIAHELGHFLLHSDRDLFVDKQFIVHRRDGNSSTGQDPLEVEANQFAAELLMPADKVRDLFNRHPFDFDDETALRKLASTFGVSPMAMAVRLSSLGSGRPESRAET